MKGKLQSAAQYLTETEPAVRDLFESSGRYFAILKKIKPPIFIGLNTSKKASEEAFRKWQSRNRPAIKRALDRQREYLGYQFSIGTLCGSILQIAHVGIRYYSKNKAVPPDFSSIIEPGSKVARFCIGRRVREVPIGLIIYAVRNQYAHWDEERLKNQVNECIFNALASNHGMKGAEKIKDPCFDLSNRTIPIYSANVLSILGWNSYDPYIADMKNLLISSERR